jgi:hypothetical protein
MTVKMNPHSGTKTGYSRRICPFSLIYATKGSFGKPSRTEHTTPSATMPARLQAPKAPGT